MIQVRVAQELEDCWRPIVGHHVDMTLAPIRSRLRAARISLERVSFSGSEGARYRCAIVAHEKRGESFQFETQHRNAEQAIKDAFSRLRRMLTLNSRLGARALAIDS